MKKLFLMGGLAAAAVVAIGLSTSSLNVSTAEAASGCQKRCDRAFAECYKSSGGDRRSCAVARARCLNRCLRN